MKSTIPGRLFEAGRTRGAGAAIRYQTGETWATLTWADYADRVRRVGAALRARGLEKGDAIGIVSKNRAEWMISALGAMAIGCVPVGIYQTLQPEQVAYVLGHCSARMVVVDDAAQWAKVAESIDGARLDAGIRGVAIDAAGITDARVVGFAAFLDEGADGADAVEALTDALAPDDLATLIYTSGTTGEPKGVMLTHRNLAWTAEQGKGVISPSPGPHDSLVSYLPLSHIAEQMLSVHIAVTYSYTIWICERLDALREVLPIARPTLFLGVPRVWEKFKAALEGRLAELTGLKALIARWAMSVGAAAGPGVVETGPPTGLLGVQYRLASKLFFGPLRARLGLDQLRMAITGAAPLGEDVAQFFLSLGIVLHEVYGQSEASGPTTFARNVPGKRRFGTVGLPLPGVEVRIADDGEVCVRGGNVFTGYFRNPEATASTLIDGWLHSGDLGAFDADGFLKITGRKKDLIITAGGKNVGPGAIEATLKGIDGIAHAVVIGDRRKFLSALMTIEPEGAGRLARDRGWPEGVEALAAHDGFRAHVQQAVDAMNVDLARYERIKKFTLLPVEFTPETGELTPTQKVKRRVVDEKYADIIDAFYA